MAINKVALLSLSSQKFQGRRVSIIASTKLESLRLGNLRWHGFHTEFLENPPSGSKVIGAGVLQTNMAKNRS
jgi:hypothetical protein